MTSTRVRRAGSLNVHFEEGDVIVHNFLTQRIFRGAPSSLAVLAKLGDWIDRTSGEEAARAAGASNAPAVLDRLIDLTAVLEESSDLAVADDEYRRDWVWGNVAGLYHFGTKDIAYASDEEEHVFLEKLKERNVLTPPLFATNEEFEDVHRLPPPIGRSDMYQVMLRRRSERNLAPEPIPLGALSNCLYFSVAITDFVDLPFRGRLPFRATPSAGARNPFEAYVWAGAVEGLQPGIYHYSATEHSLGLVGEYVPPLASLLGDQLWTSNAAAAIVLVARLERMSCKFFAPSAYGVVLLEAGHIAQNILLTAKAEGIASGPSGAFNDAAVRQALKLERTMESPLYAVVLGRADPGGDRHAVVVPNADE